MRRTNRDRGFGSSMTSSRNEPARCDTPPARGTAFAVLLALVISTPGAGQVNPSFENNCLLPALPCTNGANYQELNSTQTCLSGWQVLSAGTIDLVGSGVWQASDGGFSVDLDGGSPGGIKQTLNTIPYATYSVTFDLAGHPFSGPTVKQMRVSVDTIPAQSQDYSFDTTNTGLCNMGWTSQAWSFVAKSTQTEITFRSLHTTSVGGAVIDRVGVDLVCVGTLGVPGINDLTINGIGSGMDCSVPLVLFPGPQVTDFAITAPPGSEVLGIISPAIDCCNFLIYPPYSVDLAPLWSLLYSPDPLTSWPAATNVVNSAGNWNLSVSHDLPGNIHRAVQFGLVHNSFFAGIASTQAFEIDIDSQLACLAEGTPTGLIADDGSLQKTYGAFGSFTFYGTLHTEMFINSNGNITFQAGDSDFSETEAELLSGLPRIAPLWDDWDPSSNLSGPIVYRESAAGWKVTWCNVPRYGETCVSSFSAEGDAGTGMITFEYPVLQTCGQNTGIVGLSPGISTSISNQVDLCPVGLNTGPLGQHAIYEVFNLNNPLDIVPSSTVIRFLDTSGTYLQLCN